MNRTELDRKIQRVRARIADPGRLLHRADGGCGVAPERAGAEEDILEPYELMRKMKCIGRVAEIKQMNLPQAAMGMCFKAVV
jgi:hypothetical protein